MKKLVFLLPLFAAPLAAAHSELLQSAYAEAAADIEPWQNAVRFYLRLAGGVWVVVEWLVAFILWRGYRAFRATARRKGFTL